MPSKRKDRTPKRKRIFYGKKTSSYNLRSAQFSQEHESSSSFKINHSSSSSSDDYLPPESQRNDEEIEVKNGNIIFDVKCLLNLLSALIKLKTI